MTVSTTHRWFIVLAAVIVVSFCYNLGGYALMEPDEGRNADIARTMAQDNAYVVPRLNTIPYGDKPVLYFAITATIMEVLGPTETAARAGSLLFTFATLGLVAWFGGVLFDRATGLIAALATAASPLTLAFSRTVIFDSTLTFFVLGAVAALYLAVEHDHGSDSRQRAVVLGWVAMACGVLTKGPIALGLPLMIVLPYALWRRRIRHPFDLVGLLAFVAVLLPWLLIMTDTAPGFLRYALVTETLRRFATTELHRGGPWWYFVPIVIAGAAPWSFLVAAQAAARARSWWNAPNRDHRVVLLAAWIVVPLVFFSLSRSKRVQYVLPLIPAVALAAAGLLAQNRLHAAARWVTAAALAGVGAVLLTAPTLVPDLFETSAAIRDAIPFVAVTLGSAAMLSAIGVIVWWRRPPLRLAALAIPTLLIPFITPALLEAIGDNRSSRALAQAVTTVDSGEIDVVGVHAYPLSLPFYLQRPIILSTDDGRELTSNFIAEFLSDWSGPDTMVRSGDWWLERLTACGAPAVFVVRRDDQARRAILARRLPQIGANRKHLVFGPCIPSSLAGRRAAPS